ncbi:MAG: tyrosine--tRNA ligase [Isosphaerales bacterium]
MSDEKNTSAERQIEILKRGIIDLHVEGELLERLREGRPLRIKAGFDPTRPDLHLGHTVVMSKMKQFQDLGHEIIFLVGDFTATIGDPTGRNAARPPLSRAELEEGVRTYAEQAFKILDPDRTKIMFNNEWLGKLTFADVVRIAGKHTLARMMERDDFTNRWRGGVSISLHELLYPLAQAYDSVVLECDVELGGTDQLINLLVGREMMKQFNIRPQIVMTTPLLEGIDARVDEQGKIDGAKMSKSLDNAIAVNEPSADMFGKLMSIPDPVMWRYYDLLTQHSSEEIATLKQGHPRDAKIALAAEIVERFHSREVAGQEVERWNHQFQKREVPVDLAQVEVAIPGQQDSLPLTVALRAAGLVKTVSEARRLIEQGGVSLDGERVTDMDLKLSRGDRRTVRVGKRRWAVLVVQ